jgi:hypothetical protein
VPVVRWCLGAAALVSALAACGGSEGSAQQQSTMPTSTAQVRCRADTARARKRLPRLRADIAAIRRARTHAVTSRATDRFIADAERSGISLTTENRLIDLAISASVGKCEDCFQALEAMRPIPSLAQHGCR